MPSRRAAVLVLAVVAAVAAYRWWTSDQRAIRKQLSILAESLSAPAAETDVRRVTRLVALRNTLAPDVRISVDARTPGPGPSMTGRETILGLINRWTPPAGGMTVQFVDVQIEVDTSGLTAQVYCTAQVSSGPGEDPNIDAREVVMTFSRLEGVWRVSAATVRTTLQAPDIEGQDNRLRL